MATPAIHELPGRRLPVSARASHRLPSSSPNCHGAKCSMPKYTAKGYSKARQQQAEADQSTHAAG